MNDIPDNAAGHEPQLGDDLKQFAAELSNLRPREDRLDRERLAFLAGQASVAGGPVLRTNVLGVPLESRVWPAAFAGMTAIAAMLLVALVLRPNDSDLRHIAADDRSASRPALMAVEAARGDGVLTTSDALLGDIQSRLAARDAGSAAVEGSWQPHDRETPLLTPNSWHQVISHTEQSKPSTDDSSSLLHSRGVTL